MPPPEPVYCDVAVIGAGGAGLRAAISAAEGGLSVLCVSKVAASRSHTAAAQGGINAALANRGADDWRWHMYDTIRGGDWLPDQDAVALLCERAADAIAELEHMGMAFTRDDAGRIYQRAYGGQRTEFGRGGLAYRACAAADRTGHAMLHMLYAQSLRSGVRFAEECAALDLIMDAEGACRGVLVWRLERGELLLLRAQCVILATGGYGQAYAATTASSICTGDGGGMALRAGLPLQDMEFVQFHPTSLYGAGLLITEGARGEGGYLRNGLGERFMARYAPQSLELASRDVIARAIAVEIREGRGCGKLKDHVHLCLEHLDAELLRERLPSVLAIARTFGRVDATRQPIPVVPAVHYTMGGIASNAASEAIGGHGEKIPGLLALGEAACTSVHGANRLGCNSLLDLVVFGRAAGERCARELRPNAAHAALPPSAAEQAMSRLNRFRHAAGGTPAAAIRKAMQQAMQMHAGIFRDAETLASGQKLLADLSAQLAEDVRMGDTSLLWNDELLGALETENLLLQARATLESAQFRTESRGAHWREDFPARDDAHWLMHTLCGMDGQTKMHPGTRPVRAHDRADCPVFTPEPRSY